MDCRRGDRVAILLERRRIHRGDLVCSVAPGNRLALNCFDSELFVHTQQWHAAVARRRGRRRLRAGRHRTVQIVGPGGCSQAGRASQAPRAACQRAKTAIILVCTETPSSTLSLTVNSWRHPRLAGLMWGGEDLSARSALLPIATIRAATLRRFCWRGNLWRPSCFSCRSQPSRKAFLSTLG